MKQQSTGRKEEGEMSWTDCETSSMAFNGCPPPLLCIRVSDAIVISKSVPGPSLAWLTIIIFSLLCF